MNTSTKALALGAILSGAFLTGCGASQDTARIAEEAHELARMAIEAADANAHRLNLAEGDKEVASMASETAAEAHELARMAISAADANAHRLNLMMVDMQKK